MNDRQKIIRALRVYYCETLVEDPIDGSSFDNEVLNALDKLFDAHRDVVVPQECVAIGFVLKSATKPDDFIDPCSTVPCFGGKMPYQTDKTLCAVCISTGGLCDQSPVQAVKDLSATSSKKQEASDDFGRRHDPTL